MGTELRERMTGGKQARALGQGSGTKPASNTSQLHDIKHDVIGGVRRDALGHIVRSPPILTELDCCSGHCRDTGMPLEVIGAGRLFDPEKLLFVEHAYPMTPCRVLCKNTGGKSQQEIPRLIR